MDIQFNFRKANCQETRKENRGGGLSTVYKIMKTAENNVFTWVWERKHSFYTPPF